MTDRLTVALDLDGTLIHPERAEIAIPGRTRCNYLSSRVAEGLVRLSEVADVFVASARNAPSVYGFVSRVPGFRPVGFVCECGFVATSDLEHGFVGDSWERSDQRELLARDLSANLANWTWIKGYQRLIAGVPPQCESDPQTRVRAVLNAGDEFGHWQVVQERRKTFLYPGRPCKWSGLKTLGLEQLDIAAGDDPVYDATMLQAARIPLTIGPSNSTMCEMIRRCGGISISTEHRSVHQASEALLNTLVLLCKNQDWQSVSDIAQSGLI